MHSNSLAAYESIIDKLPKSQAQVFACVAQSRIPLTRQDVARILGWEINRVTGRVKELIETRRLEEHGEVVIGGRPRATLRVRPKTKGLEYCPDCQSVLHEFDNYVCKSPRHPK